MTNRLCMPWEDKPAGCDSVVWRYSKNPVIPDNQIKCSNSIFNSAVVPYEDGFAGVFRCDSKSRQLRLHSGFSKDAINWTIEEEPINFITDLEEYKSSRSRYDPRVVWIEDRYYVTWCQDYHGPTIAVAYTYNFKEFYQIEHAFLPYNRNGVLFPKKINGRYAMLSRPSDKGQTPFGDIFYSESPDMNFWGNHRFVMGATRGWQKTKIGAGAVPIETKDGWLVFYHGVLTSCNGFTYSMGAALLDIEKPWKVLYRTDNYILTPQTYYERVGDVPNVVFPCAALHDKSSGKIAIYYGAADTVVALAFTLEDELLSYIKSNSVV